MDALYFIKVIIEGKDNLSPSLRSASASMRAEFAKLRGEVKALGAEYSGAASGSNVLSRASKNSTEESKKQVNAFRDVTKNVSSVANAFRAGASDMEKFEKSGSRVEKMLFRAGSAFRGASRAIFDTQRGVRDMDFATRKAEGSIFNLAYNGMRNLDNFAKSFARMNTIAALLAPLLFTVVQAVLNLGAALVALASAAGEAAAALGGALLAGLMQLIPVVGLLVASFHRLQLILQAYKLQQQSAAASSQTAAQAAKAHREAVERLADAQYNLAEAYINVKNQAFDLKEAEMQLTNIRRQAARDLVDSQNARVDAVLAERSAMLSLKDARLQLMALERQQQSQSDLMRDRKAALEQAQRAVEAAKVQGDPAQLSLAMQQLGAAQSNFSAVAQGRQGLVGQQQALQLQQARLGVNEAVQRQKEAQIAVKRAVEDTNRLQKYGVDHAPEVVRAQHNITTSTHQLANAHRAVAKAQREESDAASDLRNKTYSGAATGQNKQLDIILKQLDPVEKKLLATVDRFMKMWKNVSRPITDAVLTGINDALDIVAKNLLGDSKFMKAWQGLGNVIGKQITRFAEFLTSPAQKRFFETFIDLAGKNLPTIVTLFERVLSLVERIAIAFAPVFANILGGVNRFVGGRINRADQPAGVQGGQFPANRMGAFAAESQGFLKSVGDFFGSLFHLMGAIGHVAKGPGRDAFEGLTNLFNTWAQELRDSKEKGGQEFFANAIRTSALILKLFGQLVTIFFKLASGSGFDAFVKTFGTIFVPALERFGKWYGDMFAIVVKAGNWGGLDSLLSWVTSFYLLSKLTPLGQLTSSVWHGLVIGLLTKIALNTAVMAGTGGGWLAKLVTIQGKSLGILARAGILAAGFAAGYTLGTLIQRLLPRTVTNAIGGAIARIPGLGAGGSQDQAQHQLPPNSPARSVQYLYKLFYDNIRGGMSPFTAADSVRRHHNIGDAKFNYQGKWYAGGGSVAGNVGRAVPIVAHVGEWVLNQMQQVKLAQALRRPISWIQQMLFGGTGGATRTRFGGKDEFGANRMLSNWNDQQFDASGTEIYGGTYFVETPLGQWVQLARATISKMQRHPGWLPHSLLTSAGFQGANPEQLREWSARMFQRANDPYFQFHSTPDRTPSFAAGGVVTSPAAVGQGGPTRSIPQHFEINTASPDVDIGYVMRVAKIHAEGM